MNHKILTSVNFLLKMLFGILLFISLILSEAEHLYMVLRVICNSFKKLNSLVIHVDHFPIALFPFFLWLVRACCMLRKAFLCASHANTFPHSLSESGFYSFFIYWNNKFESVYVVDLLWFLFSFGSYFPTVRWF